MTAPVATDEEKTTAYVPATGPSHLEPVVITEEMERRSPTQVLALIAARVRFLEGERKAFLMGVALIDEDNGGTLGIVRDQLVAFAAQTQEEIDKYDVDRRRVWRQLQDAEVHRAQMADRFAALQQQRAGELQVITERIADQVDVVDLLQKARHQIAHENEFGGRVPLDADTVALDSCLRDHVLPQVRQETVRLARLVADRDALRTAAIRPAPEPPAAPAPAPLTDTPAT